MGWIREWFAGLSSWFLQKQSSSGAGSIQADKLQGGITQVHVTQHFYAGQPAKPLDAPPKQKPSATPAQKDVLALMDHLPNRIAVLDFMEREFGTSMVIALDDKQVYRLKRYVEVVLKHPKP